MNSVWAKWWLRGKGSSFLQTSAAPAEWHVTALFHQGYLHIMFHRCHNIQPTPTYKKNAWHKHVVITESFQHEHFVFSLFFYLRNFRKGVIAMLLRRKHIAARALPFLLVQGRDEAAWRDESARDETGSQAKGRLSVSSGFPNLNEWRLIPPRVSFSSPPSKPRSLTRPAGRFWSLFVRRRIAIFCSDVPTHVLFSSGMCRGTRRVVAGWVDGFQGWDGEVEEGVIVVFFR